MQLIGVGFPRAGTLSHKVAMEKRGFSPCCGVLADLGGQVPLWDGAANARSTRRRSSTATGQPRIGLAVSSMSTFLPRTREAKGRVECARSQAAGAECHRHDR